MPSESEVIVDVPSNGNKANNIVRQSYFPSPDVDIDAASMDLPCEFAPLQWWYFNANLRSADGKADFAFFSSFFRQTNCGGAEGFNDACTWALEDVVSEKYYADSLLDHMAPDIIAGRLEPLVADNKGSHIERTIYELAKKGRLPRPDRAMKNKATYTHEEGVFKICCDDQCTMTAKGKGASRHYTVHHYNPLRDITVDLEFATKTSPVRHGYDGVVNGMFYYYYPFIDVKGTVKIGDCVTEVVGDGWYDREYGGEETESGRDALDAWVWLSLRLSDGSQFSLFNIWDSQTLLQKELIAVLTTSDGERKVSTDVQMRESNIWTSLITFSEFPLEFTVEVRDFQLSFAVSAAFAHQEFCTVLVSGGSFYEGRVAGTGERAGRPVTISGFCEQKNIQRARGTDDILRNVGRYVRKTLAELYPLEADEDFIAKHVLGRHCTGRGVDPNRVCDVLFRPVRSIIDRGGKAWRSMILVSSCNAISRDYFECSQYIALAELLHVGSLIIDDIQDDSSIRRGGNTVHLEYGIATAINAGTACYFMAPTLARIDSLSIEKTNRFYKLYFDIMRAGHAGQGLDICGLDHLMPAAVSTGNSEPLYDALIAIHTYKTGGAAATVCLLAAILCDANEELSSAIEQFGLGLGLAFQIVDDALNLKGFDGNLKEAGEDIRDGKITYPVAKAIGRLPLEGRERLWAILQEKTSDLEKIKEAIDIINEVNGVDDCLKEAENIVNEKWAPLDALLEDSLPKLMMRTFCSFLTERRR